MKKTLFFAAVAALFTFASCQKEEAPVQNQGEDPVFTATIAGQNTKTTVDASTAKVAWVAEDEITVTDAASTSVNTRFPLSIRAVPPSPRLKVSPHSEQALTPQFTAPTQAHLSHTALRHRHFR